MDDTRTITAVGTLHDEQGQKLVLQTTAAGQPEMLICSISPALAGKLCSAVLGGIIPRQPASQVGLQQAAQNAAPVALKPAP